MSFAGQVILSSSPPRVATPLLRSVTPISSSPLLPSPSQLFATKFANKTEVRVEYAKSNDVIWAEVSATTVKNSVPTLDHLQGEVNSIEGDGSTKRKKTEIKKSKAREEEIETLPNGPITCKVTAQKRSSKSTVTVEGSESSEQTALSAKPAVKKKSRQTRDGKSQSKIEGSRITKPGVTSDTTTKKDKSASSKKSPAKNDTAPKDSSKKKAKSSPAEKQSLDLLLAEAVRRRRAWTPPKETPLETLDLGKLGRELNETLTLETEEPGIPAPGGFDNLLGDFGYTSKGQGSCIGSDQSRNTNGEAVTKKRKLELVNLAPLAQPRKTKSPKKKPQTVTAKATAQFLAVEPGTPSLLQYLESESLDDKQLTHRDDSETQTRTSNGVRRKSKLKNPTQPKSANSKIKSQPSQVLHSPKTAMKSADEQELIFGTSSQLAREESPTCLRDIQQAIINSQKMFEENVMSPTGNTTPKLSCNLPQRAGPKPLVGSKNLWSVASRDLDGSLLAVDVIDLIDTPGQPKKKPLPSVSEPGTTSDMEGTKGCAAEAGPSKALPSDTEVLPTPSKPLQSKQTDPSLEQLIPRSLAEASLRNRRQSRSPVKKQKILKDSGVPLQDPTVKERPNYQGFTDADLRKEIASFGFKAIKKRNEMIALLERCWDSQARIALQTLQPNMKAVNAVASREDQPTQTKPSKRKGKQKEPTTAVPDSNITAPAPKPRGRPRKTPISPRPSLPEPAPVPCLEPPISSTVSSLEPDIYAKITNAINAAPATHSATHPTFRERMLLYDPIVLEDLTVWLNTEGLGMVGTDEEVGIGVVKEWCQRESVCCHSRNESSTTRR